MAIKDLIEKRANVWAQMQDMRSSVDKDGWTDELRASWDAADTDIVSLSGDIDREERDEAIDKSFATIDERAKIIDPSTGIPSGDAAKRYGEVFDKFLRYGREGMDSDERSLLQANFVSPDQRAQSAGTTTTGGFTVPQGFWAKVTDTMKYFGGALDTVEILDTDTGNPLPWPTADDTGNVGAILAENTQIAGQDITFGQKQLGAYMYTSKLVLASLQFLQDTGIDAEGYVAKKIGQRLGRIWNTHLTTGTGTAQPQGFVTGATTGKTTATSGAILYAELVDLQHSVDVAYRNVNCRWQMHDLILAAVRKLVDTQGHPLWEPSLQTGLPSTLLGFPITVNNDMDSTLATTKKTIAFGDFASQYVARRVAGGQLVRLDERYADYLQVGFFGFGRIDGLVQDASAVKLLVQV